MDFETTTDGTTAAPVRRPTPETGIVPRELAARPIEAGVDIGHVHLKASNLDRIRAFYVDILGFDVVFHVPDALFIAAGGYHHTLGFNTWQSRGGTPPPAGTTGLYHVAIHLRDPEENGLELCWDRPREEWPRDEDGHLTLGGNQLDFESLLREGL